MRGSRRWTTLIGVSTALLAVLMVGAASASAKSLWVSPTGTITTPGKSCTSPGFKSIQAAIEEAPTGATIHVCPGTYAEQLTIEQSVKLKATGTAGSAKVVLPEPAKIATATPTCETSIPAQYQRDKDEISICTNGTVTITGLAIEAQFPNECYDSLYGIFVGKESTLIATNDTVNGASASPINGCQGGVGIEVGTARTPTSEVGHATLKQDTVTGYQKDGITVEGTGSEVNVTSSKVTGAGPTPAIAQNGIQISYGSKGTIKSSTVEGNECNVASCGVEGEQASGVLFYEAGAGSTVTSTEINKNDLGFYYLAEAATQPAAPETTLSKDTFNENRYEAIGLDQGWVEITKDNLNGPGNAGIEVFQYEGQSYAPNSSATSDKIKNMNVAVKVSSDDQPGDHAGSFKISKSLTSENAKEEEDNSLNFPIIQENDF